MFFFRSRFIPNVTVLNREVGRSHFSLSRSCLSASCSCSSNFHFRKSRLKNGRVTLIFTVLRLFGAKPSVHRSDRLFGSVFLTSTNHVFDNTFYDWFEM